MFQVFIYHQRACQDIQSGCWEPYASGGGSLVFMQSGAITPLSLITNAASRVMMQVPKLPIKNTSKLINFQLIALLKNGTGSYKLFPNTVSIEYLQLIVGIRQQNQQSMQPPIAISVVQWLSHRTPVRPVQVRIPTDPTVGTVCC